MNLFTIMDLTDKELFKTTAKYGFLGTQKYFIKNFEVLKLVD